MRAHHVKKELFVRVRSVLHDHMKNRRVGSGCAFVFVAVMEFIVIACPFRPAFG